MIPPIASRFVAGETVAAALEHARATNDDDVKVILNLLGEHQADPESARADAAAYRELIADIAGTDLDACVSVKPSQIGLDVSTDCFRENLTGIVEAGHERDVFVWIDMEDASTTDDTLDAFVDLAEAYPWTVGQCLQSNLRRTHTDLERVVDVPGKIRIVKGAYDEPKSFAYTEKQRINEAYRADIEYLFEHRDRGIAVGSHDPEMIAHTQALADDHGTEYEIQMLMGVREDAQRDLAAQGVDVWQYAPYGDKWASYFYRRLRERKANVLFALRAILGR